MFSVTIRAITTMSDVLEDRIYTPEGYKLRNRSQVQPVTITADKSSRLRVREKTEIALQNGS